MKEYDNLTEYYGSILQSSLLILLIFLAYLISGLNVHNVFNHHDG
jgi:hypothetical protein